jgi:hypothetical protein
MPKRKLERMKLSKQFLTDLLTPFRVIGEIVDIEIKNDEIIVDYRSADPIVVKGGVINTS